MREKSYLFAMNGGEVSPLALGRVDLSRMRISAEVMKNCFPRVIGPMAARPGLAYLSSTDGDGEARNIPFVFSAEDTALVEVSDHKLRVRVDGELISRPAVSTAVTNGDFSSSAGWTLTTTGNGVSTIAGGVLTLQTPDRGGTTLARRSDSVSGDDQSVEHAIEITVDRGPVKFRCGSSDGGDEYIGETELKTGFHSIAFTPVSGVFHIQFSCESEAVRVISNVAIAPSGTMELVTSWPATALFNLRYAQSGDVIFVTSSDQAHKPMRIERRANATALQAACDAIGDDGHVVVPPGSYALDTVTLTKNTSGPGRFELNAFGSDFTGTPEIILDSCKSISLVGADMPIGTLKMQGCWLSHIERSRIAVVEFGASAGASFSNAFRNVFSRCELQLIDYAGGNGPWNANS